MGRPRTTLESVLSDVSPEPMTGCWLWTGGTVDRNGYGKVSYADRPIYVHRFVYERTIGPIPPGLFILHRCDVPACVNPDHLYAGTNQLNVDDKMRRGRWAGGRPATPTCGRGHQKTLGQNQCKSCARLTQRILRNTRKEFQSCV
jgi:hypothetical protein